MAEMMEPTTTATRYNNQPPSTSGQTKIPPCGARSPIVNIMDNAPVPAEPTITDGMTRSGSLAAKGIAPSAIKDKPIIQFTLPASRSSCEDLVPRHGDALVQPN